MKGFTLWFTGLPSSGKTTLARRLETALQARGLSVMVLDGDEVRLRLSKGLTFSKEDRDENIRRIGFVAKAITQSGGIAIACAISPYRSVREECRREIGRFLEVYVDCPLEECVRRDVKGLYKKALAGEIKQFTGISDPYEPPLAPEVAVRTAELSQEQCIEAILRRAEGIGFLVREGASPQVPILLDRDVAEALAARTAGPAAPSPSALLRALLGTRGA